MEPDLSLDHSPVPLTSSTVIHILDSLLPSFPSRSSSDLSYKIKKPKFNTIATHSLQNSPQQSSQHSISSVSVLNSLLRFHFLKLPIILSYSSEIQAISLVSAFLNKIYSIEEGPPALFVVSSLSINLWETQLRLFNPSFTILNYSSTSDLDCIREKALKPYYYNALLIPFDLISSEQSLLQTIKWNYAFIYDQYADLSRFFSTRNRLLLSQDPFTSNVLDLFTITTFIIPDFVLSRQVQDPSALLPYLHNLISPFSLSLPSQPLQPPSVEYKYIFLALSKPQFDKYNSLVKKRAPLSRSDLIDSVTKLRRISSIPSAPSPKLSFLTSLVSSLWPSKILILSQFSQSLITASEVLKDDYPVLLFNENSSLIQKQHISNIFRNSKSAILLALTNSIDFQVNLSGSSVLIVLEPTFDPYTLSSIQSLTNLSSSQLKIYTLISSRTLEESILGVSFNIYYSSPKSLFVSSDLLQSMIKPIEKESPIEGMKQIMDFSAQKFKDLYRTLRIERGYDREDESSKKKQYKERDLCILKWTREDEIKYMEGCVLFGTYNSYSIAEYVESKTKEEVETYGTMFWEKCLPSSSRSSLFKIVDNDNPLLNTTLSISEYSLSVLDYSLEEDLFLLQFVLEFGYGLWELLKSEVKRREEFKFDYWFQSRSEKELKQRCDFLIIGLRDNPRPKRTPKLKEKREEEIKEASVFVTLDKNWIITLSRDN